MSQLDIDDLVASLNSSAHISQEAVDLATLQAQLAQTLYSIPISKHTGQSNSGYAPSNTPTSSSANWSAFTGPTERRRHNSFSEDMHMSEDEELDEVENMFPSSGRGRSSVNPNAGSFETSPSSSRPAYHSSSSNQTQIHNIHTHPRSSGMQGSQFPLQHQARTSPATNYNYSPISQSSNPHYNTYQAYSDPSNSSFATTDPFYLAQLMASQRPPQSHFFPHTPGPPLTVPSTSDPRYGPFASTPAGSGSL